MPLPVTSPVPAPGVHRAAIAMRAPGARTPGGAAAPRAPVGPRAAQAPDLPFRARPRFGPVPGTERRKPCKSVPPTAADRSYVLSRHDVLYCALRYKHSTIHKNITHM